MVGGAFILFINSTRPKQNEVKILEFGSQGPDYLTWFIPWLLMDWSLLRSQVISSHGIEQVLMDYCGLCTRGVNGDKIWWILIMTDWSIFCQELLCNIWNIQHRLITLLHWHTPYESRRGKSLQHIQAWIKGLTLCKWHFYPRPVLAFGYWRCLHLSVCLCVRVSVSELVSTWQLVTHSSQDLQIWTRVVKQLG